MKIEFEFVNGGSAVHLDVLDSAEAWALVRAIERQCGEILSAWRDDEPWFGLCAQDFVSP